MGQPSQTVSCDEMRESRVSVVREGCSRVSELCHVPILECLLKEGGVSTMWIHHSSRKKLLFLRYGSYSSEPVHQKVKRIMNVCCHYGLIPVVLDFFIHSQQLL